MPSRISICRGCGSKMTKVEGGGYTYAIHMTDGTTSAWPWDRAPVTSRAEARRRHMRGCSVRRLRMALRDMRAAIIVMGCAVRGIPKT